MLQCKLFNFTIMMVIIRTYVCIYVYACIQNYHTIFGSNSMQHQNTTPFNVNVIIYTYSYLYSYSINVCHNKFLLNKIKSKNVDTLVGYMEFGMYYNLS